ncbi:hypothetical protein BDV96DRAFT_595451 [Lophiotrema nucula]|uniref:DUF6604 domain-containing protein n=1 Tax=Lophiotrema nucula TaxID=690887 RepID=A0A6A5ZLW4_9PLEO|nr:hypothetical protein BDV96DRAFT_595451 [Lophiotrema nucula]
MGLSPLLAHTYRRYKEGTSQIVQWLAETARATGLVNHMFEAQTTEGGRKKGKQRKGTSRQGATYLLPVNAFLTFANAIASVKTEVPVHLIATLRDVIRLRKSFGSWYSSPEADNTANSSTTSDGHQHFIAVLERVSDLLAPHSGNEFAKVQFERSSGAEKLRLSNMFEHLEVQECDDTLSTGTMAPPVKKSQRQDTYKLETRPEDTSLALYCLMKDLTDMRFFVRQTWDEYRNKQVSLETAATIMNMAISVFRSLNETLVAEFPQFKSHMDVISSLWGDYRCPNLDPSEDPFDWGTYQTDDVQLTSKSLFCDNTCGWLAKFLLGSNRRPMYRSMHPNFLSQDEETLLRCLSLFSLMDECSGNLKGLRKPYSDNVLEAVAYIRENQTIPTWAVFAVQLFIDTRRVLRHDTSRGLRDLRDTALWLRESLNSCEEHAKYFQINEWYTLSKNLFSDLNNIINIALDIDVSQCLLLEAVGSSAPELSWGTDFLYSNHPMMCGHLLAKMLHRFHMLGTHISGQQRMVLSTMHLYNAARQLGRLSGKWQWEDLDYMINMQGSDYVFAGARPKTALECCRRQGLVFGEPASKWALDKSGRSHSREWERESKTGERVYPGKKYRMRWLRMTSKWVRECWIMGPDSLSASRAQEDPLHMLECHVRHYIEERPSKQGSGVNSNMTALQSLQVLKDVLKDDEFILRFDLTAMNRKCIDLFRRIQSFCIAESPEYYVVEQVSGDRRIKVMLDKILIGEAMPYMRDGSPSHFIEVCVQLAKLIHGEGNAELMKAEARHNVQRGDGPALAASELVDLEDPVYETCPYELRQFFDEIEPENRFIFRTRGFRGIGLRNIAPISKRGDWGKGQVVEDKDLDKKELDTYYEYVPGMNSALPAEGDSRD